MNDLWDVYTLTNIAGIAVSFSGLSDGTKPSRLAAKGALLLTWLFSSILLRPENSGIVPIASRDPNRIR
jgi:hypothetical protein